MQRDEFQVKSFPGLPRFEVDRSSGRSLRVCIATEEIFGPVRNGGIASTYYHLARTLVSDGHEVTVLYLKGMKCENETIGHWMEFYRRLDIRFVPLPPEPSELICPSPRWQRQMYEFHRWLMSEGPYDIVHASEWRGGVYYALLAKRQGLAFERTLFLVKTSSPWIWNRHYRMLPLGDKSELGRMYPERRVVELADIVIGGSAHLLTFMERKGYRLPAGRTFVQPNIIDFQDLNVEEKRPRYRYGDRVKTGELVFFGRLEARKGLDIFCEAVTRLTAMGVRPWKITFLGKQGEKLSAYPRMAPIKFIEQQAQAWPFPVEIIDFYDQDKAIGYLCASPRIAVMPSVIENSTMTVYECLVHKVPFVATSVGGTPELIAEGYHDRVLTQAHPESLAAALQEVLREGGTVAEGAFDYQENLAVWRDFHRCLAVALAEKPVNEVVADLGGRHRDEEVPGPRMPGGGASVRPAAAEALGQDGTDAGLRVSVCIYYHQRPQLLEALLESLLLQDGELDEVVIMNDGPVSEEVLGMVGSVEERSGSTEWKMLDQPHRCIGPALNAAAARASGDLFVFLNAEHHYCEPNLIGVLRRAAMKSPAAAFTCFHALFEGERPGQDDDDGIRVVPLGGDLATGFYEDGVFGGSCFAVRRSVFLELGGFYEGYHLGGIEQEFHTRLVLAGHDLDVVPEVLYRERRVQSAIPFDTRSKDYLAIRPFLQSAPNYLENILLTARTLAQKSERAGTGVRHHRGSLAAHRGEPATARQGPFMAFARRIYHWSALTAHRGGWATARQGSVMALARRILQSAPYHLANIILTARMLVRKAEHAGAGVHYHRGALTVDRGDAATARQGPVMALARRRSRFRLGRLEVDIRLNPAWIDQARQERGHDPALDLRRNGRVLAQFFARGGSSDFLRISVRPRVLAIGDALYSIHDVSTGETLAALAVPGWWRTRRVEGAVENRPRPEIRGWILDPVEYGRRRRIAIHMNGSLCEVLCADEQRDDIRRWKGTDGGHGFLWQIPEAVSARNGTRIDVFDADTGRPLRGSPVRVEGGQVVARGSRGT